MPEKDDVTFPPSNLIVVEDDVTLAREELTERREWNRDLVKLAHSPNLKHFAIPVVEEWLL